MADYVNEPTDQQRKSPERRGCCHSGESKIFLVVGVSFGLLCIVQAALNISLRLQGTGSDHINSTNITMMSSAEISNLLRDRDLLIRENTMLYANEKWLERHLSEQQNQIKELQAEIKRLSEMGSQHSHCPRGWKFHMSSCYRLSTELKNWRDAKEDCGRNGADLVVLNDDSEAEILLKFGSAVMWIDLRARRWPQDMWMWEDGRLLTLDDLKKMQPGDPSFTCAYAEQLLPDRLRFIPADCADQHYWVCEMMVM
ncbi:C-type lectin lectoxin-Phi1-like isoform X2 [Epinephelus lanceolatus]